MFIQTEATPNPATLKFLPGRTVLADGTLDMRDPAQAARSPLAERLFEIDGVDGVFYGSDFITVSKRDGEWQQLKPAVLGAIMEHFMSGVPLVRSNAEAGDPPPEGAEETVCRRQGTGASFTPASVRTLDNILVGAPAADHNAALLL